MKIKIETELKSEASSAPQFATEASSAEIHEALDAVNGKAVAFTVTSAHAVLRLALRAEEFLSQHGVPETYRTGATVSFRPVGPSATAYKNAAISTGVTLTRTGSNWFLTDVKRSQVYPRNPERFAVTITDRAAEALVRRTLKAFGHEPQSEQLSIPA